MHAHRGIVIHDGSRYTRFFGYHRDPPHKRTQKDAREFILQLKAAPLADVVNNRQFRDPTMDQGPFGSCGGHGEAQGLGTADNMNIGYGKYTTSVFGFVPSPNDIYGGTRRVTLADPTIKLTDSGVNPADLMTFVENFGVRAIQAPTPDGRYSDCYDANVNVDPDFQDLMTSGKKVITGEYRVNETDPNLITTLRTILSVAKAPIGIGGFVDMSVMDFQSDSPAVGKPNFDDPNGGGHWITCDGYRKNANTGLYEFDIHNSWGALYGDLGSFWAGEDFMKSLFDIYAYTISVA